MVDKFVRRKRKKNQFFCSLDPHPQPTSEQDSECDPEPDPRLCVSVPGPGFVLVSSDIEVQIL